MKVGDCFSDRENCRMEPTETGKNLDVGSKICSIWKYHERPEW